MKTLSQIASEVAQWSRENFGEQISKVTGEVRGAKNPAFGVVEEDGELVHCYLKRHQGIRGFDDEQHFVKKRNDAIADIVIYLMDYCARADGDFCSIESSFHSPLNGDDIAPYDLDICLANIAKQSAGIMYDSCLGLTVCKNTAIRLLFELKILCAIEGVDLVQCVNDTWDRVVSKRNWNACAGE